MKPLPDLENTDAMLLRGRRSVLASARNEAAEALRDACTFIQSSDWDELPAHAVKAREAASRLIDVAGLWDGLGK